MAFNPNAVFVSPSSLADLDKCPQLYYYRYVYRTPRNLKIQIISPALALGTAVHDTIEQFMKLDPAERKHEELARIFNFVWENVSGEKGGFATAEQETEAKQRGEAMMERFWGNSEFRTHIPAQFPGFPKVDIGPDLILTGKLDWIQKENDGSYTIIDFKTGKNKEREDSYQLPIYTILVKKLMKTDEVQAKYWYLEEGSGMEDMKLPDLEEAFAKIKQKGEVMQMVRKTSSYSCQSGGESCWACKDILAVAKNNAGKLVKIDPGHNQEIYILPGKTKEEILVADDIPF